MRYSVAAKIAIAGLGRFVGRIVERRRHGCRQIEAIFAHDRTRIGERRRIRHRRAGADHRRIVTGHVGNGQRDDARRVSAFSQAPTLDTGQVLSHAVDLPDIGAAAQQRSRRRLLVGEVDARGRRDPIGRRAAGQKHQNEIVGSGRIGIGKRPLGASQPRLVGDRMPGLDHGDAPGRPSIAVTGDGDAVEAIRRHPSQIMGFGDFGERAGALAGREHDQPAPRRRFGQAWRQAARRMRGGDRGAKQRFEEVARLRRQSFALSGRGTMESAEPDLYLSNS